MPELPEVEATRLSFAHLIEGSVVHDVRLGKPLRWPLGVEASALVGSRIGAASRRGKYLWLPLTRPSAATAAQPGDRALAVPTGAAGEVAGGLLLHLGMSGSLSFASGDVAPAGPHDHFDLVTSAGTLRLTDPRRFGAVVWSRSPSSGIAAKLLGGLGLEPFDPAFTGDVLWRALKKRRVPVKVALLNGDIVVGAGNIYACEALHAAGIDPRTRSDRLSRQRCARLADALRATLERALALGGSTLRNYRDASGSAGAFQLQASVYGRAGAPCLVCASPVRRIVQGQRSTFFCPRCQRR